MHQSFWWYQTEVSKAEDEDKDIKSFVKHVHQWVIFVT